MPPKAKTTSEWSEVKIKLEKKNHKDLMKLIKALYDRSKNNKNFIKASISDGQESIQTFKHVITDAIYLDTNDQNCEIEFSKARKAISDFKKANGDAKCVLDLMIHYVEVGTDQTNGICIDYGEYYDSLESMFSSIIKRLTSQDKKYANYFRLRLEAVINNSTKAGYGYGETIKEMFYKAFP